MHYYMFLGRKELRYFVMVTIELSSEKVTLDTY